MSTASAETILLVEDDIDIRETLAELLTDDGYRVVEARTGVEAMAHLHSGAPLPWVIVLDLMMPEMNGWQFRAEMLKVPSLRNIPVVVISADSGMREKLAGLGVHGFVRKPLELEELFRCFASLPRRPNPQAG